MAPKNPRVRRRCSHILQLLFNQVPSSFVPSALSPPDTLPRLMTLSFRYCTDRHHRHESLTLSSQFQLIAEFFEGLTWFDTRGLPLHNLMYFQYTHVLFMRYNITAALRLR